MSLSNTLSCRSKVSANLTLVLLATILAVASSSSWLFRGAQADLFSASVSSSADSSGADSISSSPKRQYFIAPRVGRAPSGGNSAIWSALEEGAFSSAGQLQPNRGYPGPLRSSLLFLVGNRRIGPRSSGLLPQARIGRRSSPVGLMPQPRVGRRSLFQEGAVEESEESGSQQEVAVPTLTDNSFSDALEALVA